METTEVRALQNVNIAPHGVQMHLEKGEKYAIPTDTVDDYVRGRYVEVVATKKAAPRKATK